MTSSMTAFTRQQADFEWGNLIWEIRTVNHRYLDATIRLPEQLRHLENPLRDLLRKTISRGKVEAQLRLTFNDSQQRSIELDSAMLADLLETEAKLRAKLPDALPLNTLELMKFPGVLREADKDTSTMDADTLSLFRDAVAGLQEARDREGTEMATVVIQRLDGIDTIVADIRTSIPEILEKQRKRINEQVAELSVELDPQRLEQEVVIITQKADILEELDRLETHIREIRRVLTTREPVGRRLDFLLQELNREANTICSKAIVTETTLNAVELKVLIEQMREQVQNIE